MSQPDSTRRRGEHLSFFRQSGWMLLATVVAGAFNSLVHTAAKEMPSREQYALFTAMVDATLLLQIPAGGVQGVFAQMSAAAVTEESRRTLRAAVRGVLRASVGLWILLAVAVFVAQGAMMTAFKASSPLIFWATLGVGLCSLWYPVVAGVLQGRQDFFWLGNTMIAAGVGRLAAVAALVIGLHAAAAGAMVGVLLGAGASLGVALWASRDVWRGPAEGFAFAPWMRRLVPVTFGLAAGTVLLSFDTLLVQKIFGDAQTAYYGAAGRIGRALVMFTTPVALVLFPHVARSAATGEPTGALKLALGATLGTGLGAAVICTLLPELPLRILYAGQPDFLKAAPLVPWFAWSMMPLTAAYTLVNNLIARGRFTAVPWLVAVAVGYVTTLVLMRERLAAMPAFEAFRGVLATLGGFSLLLLAVATIFSLRSTDRPAQAG